MKRFYSHIFFICIATCMACKSAKITNPKPDWVQNRPINQLYYIGIGIASKKNNPYDYQQVAKKNAVNDLVSEIKITVSSNSVLSQFQNNNEFKQQFESDVKVTAKNTIEEFNVMGSWEDAESFWIYYRLSKDEYKAAIRRKLNAAIDQAENYYTKAESLPKDQFAQSVRLKIKALAALQPYLNEDVQTVYRGKNVYFVNELVSSIQDQLYEIEVVSNTTVVEAKSGRSIPNPFEVKVQYRDDKSPVAFVPLTTLSNQNSIEATTSGETDQSGLGTVAISRISNKAPVQQIQVAANMNDFMKADSLNHTLQSILRSLDVPSAAVRVNVMPIKVFIESEELNLSLKMQIHYLELALKKQLSADGCNFSNRKDDADYVLKIQSNTYSLGNIWGNMRSVALDMSVSLVSRENNVEVFKDGLTGVKGFQLTDSDAGIDAYKTATEQMLTKMYPRLQKEMTGQAKK